MLISIVKGVLLALPAILLAMLILNIAQATKRGAIKFLAIVALLILQLAMMRFIYFIVVGDDTGFVASQNLRFAFGAAGLVEVLFLLVFALLKGKLLPRRP